jgi:hypothetical protein
VRRLIALGAAIATIGLAGGAAQAACLKANAPDQIVEGRLSEVEISIPDYGLKEWAFILRLASDACLEGSDEYDKVDRADRIHVFTMDADMRNRLRGRIGKPIRRVRIIGEPFGAHTAHHHAPIVMRVTRVETVARK